MPDHNQIFLSSSRNDLDAAATLWAQIEPRGLPIVKVDQSIRAGDQWLMRLQEAVDGCAGFVVLVGRDGVGRWIGARTLVALTCCFGPHDRAEGLLIFPVLLGEVRPETLPAFLRLFQGTAWTGRDPLSERLLHRIRSRTVVTSEAAAFDGCPGPLVCMLICVSLTAALADGTASHVPPAELGGRVA